MLEIGITGLATLNHLLLLLQVEASSIFLQKDSADGALQAAVFRRPLDALTVFFLAIGIAFAEISLT